MLQKRMSLVAREQSRSYRKRLRAGNIFRCILNAIGATEPFGQKILFPFFRNHAYMPPSRPEQRGVARDRHDTWGGDAMDVGLA